MERCNYNNEALYAEEVAKDFGYEEQIRRAGSEGRLVCYGCGKPVIFNRGEVKKPYFSHKQGNDPCEYGVYSRYFDRRTAFGKGIKEELYAFFKRCYPDYIVTKDDKIIEHHWTDIAITSKNREKIFAIEIDDKTMMQKGLEDKISQYIKKGIVFDVFIIDEVKSIIDDSKAYYIKRKQLNDSPYHMAFVIDKVTRKLGVYKLDKTKYYDDAINFEHKFEDNVFFMECHLSDVYLGSKGLKVNGVNDEYNSWFMKRKEDFIGIINMKKKYQLEQADQIKLYEQMIRKREEINSFDSNIHIKKVVPERLRKSFETTEDCIIISNEVKWYQCTSCDEIKEENEMTSRGGEGSLHKGLCESCSSKRRKKIF